MAEDFSMITKKQVKQLLDQIQAQKGRRPLVFHFRCENKRGDGGITIAAIDDGEDRVLGASVCSPLDQYDKAIGSTIALNRAIAATNKQYANRVQLLDFSKRLCKAKQYTIPQVRKHAIEFASDVLANPILMITPYQIDPISELGFTDPRFATSTII